MDERLRFVARLLDGEKMAPLVITNENGPAGPMLVKGQCEVAPRKF